MFVIDGVDMTTTLALFIITIFWGCYMFYLACYCCEEKDMNFVDVFNRHVNKGEKVRRREWPEDEVMVLRETPFGAHFFRGPYNGNGRIVNLSALDILADDWIVAYDEIMELEPQLDLIPP